MKNLKHILWAERILELIILFFESYWVLISTISFKPIFFCPKLMISYIFQFLYVKYKRKLLIILFYITKRLEEKENIFLLINYLCSVIYKRNRGASKFYSKHFVRHSSLILEAPDPLLKGMAHGTLSHPFWIHPAYLLLFFVSLQLFIHMHRSDHLS